MQSSRWDKFRILTIALIFSVALNIGLCLAFILSALEKKEELSPIARVGGELDISPTNRQILSEMLTLSFHELLVYLTDLEPVEEGYLKRDLALSALVAAHHFNLEKVLCSSFLQTRTVVLSPQESITLYPALADEQYEAIIRFGYQETWPFTSKGLFLKLTSKPRGSIEKSLADAFFATSESHFVQTLFQKTSCLEPAEVLLDLIVEGPWEVLQQFSKEQEKVLDLSIEGRRALLLSYLTFRSKTAAKLLLRSDFSFASFKLTDEAVLFVLDLLQEKTVDAERYCMGLLHSLRKDVVLEKAASKLYAFSGEEVPSPLDLKAALARFHVDPVPVATTVAPPSLPRHREHIVQEGESLWRISRQYKVKVEDLIEYNGLAQDRLFPGMVLKIP